MDKHLWKMATSNPTDQCTFLVHGPRWAEGGTWPQGPWRDGQLTWATAPAGTGLASRTGAGCSTCRTGWPARGSAPELSLDTKGSKIQSWLTLRRIKNTCFSSLFYGQSIHTAPTVLCLVVMEDNELNSKLSIVITCILGKSVTPLRPFKVVKVSTIIPLEIIFFWHPRLLSSKFHNYVLNWI